jgi:hypothetical protein
MKYCKNCEKQVHNLYCSYCGQPVKVERITFSYIWHDVFHFFTHMERGFLFTSVHMLVSPGKTVNDFITGKRKRYQSPISYFLIWTTIYILFLYWIEKGFGENRVINFSEYFGPLNTTKLAVSHLSLVLAIVIPFQAFYLFILVTKKTYNYFETLTATIYALGTIILLQFVFAVTALLIHIISNSAIDLRISDVLKVLYLIWFIYNLVQFFPVKLKLLRVLAFAILAFGTFTLWRLYGFPALINWIS